MYDADAWQQHKSGGQSRTLLPFTGLPDISFYRLQGCFHNISILIIPFPINTDNQTLNTVMSIRLLLTNLIINQVISYLVTYLLFSYRLDLFC